jgi:hypothetical protein
MMTQLPSPLGEPNDGSFGEAIEILKEGFDSI